jgi:hypothetical protein
LGVGAALSRGRAFHPPSPVPHPLFGFDIDIIGCGAVPERIDAIAGALGLDGGAAVSRFAVEQRGGRVGLMMFELDLRLLQSSQLGLGWVDQRAQLVDLS